MFNNLNMWNLELLSVLLERHDPVQESVSWSPEPLYAEKIDQPREDNRDTGSPNPESIGPMSSNIPWPLLVWIM